MLDILFVNPNSAEKAYQGLSKKFSAKEPPTWSLLLAESCRSKGFGCAIIDADAADLTIKQVTNKIEYIKPRLVLFVLYGQNPNSGTTSMIGANELGIDIKNHIPNQKLAVVGSHVSALPREVLDLDWVDIILLNEGTYALHNLLRGNLKEDLLKTKGIGYKITDQSQTISILNDPEIPVPQDRMDIDLPGYAWDLLPYEKYPLDLYRAHFWHADFDHDKRTPFAAIYTSLGCQFACSFCMINIVNRVSNDENINASDSRGMRFWSPEWVNREMKKLADLGVKTLRISDEMFFFNKRYYRPILENIINNSYDFNMWTYSRIDTVRKDALELFKKAGVNWLALGIEAGNQTVRQEVSKGSFKELNIRDVCKLISDFDIKIISNYIFGFPDDNLETMNQTLDLALELNTETANFYPCQALPGSPLYTNAKIQGLDLPKNYEEFAFLSYESKPLSTKYLTSAEVLKFRDSAFKTYFTSQNYLALVENKFGIKQRQNVEEMTKINLKRRLLGN